MIQRYNIHHLINYMQFSNTDWCKSEDVEKFEQQNKQMLDELLRCYKEMDHIDKVCKLANVHPFDLMRSSLENIIISITGKKPEEL